MRCGYPIRRRLRGSWEFVNSLVAGTYGVLLIVLLTTWFYERGSSQ